MQLNEGWLVGARRVPSPHHDCRPDEEAPSLLVVHNISLPPGEFGGPWIDALFTGTLDPHAHPFFAEIAHLRVSAHCLIRRDGEIVQYVPFDKRAWHAGISCYQGRERCNDFSIGIELEGTDTLACAVPAAGGGDGTTDHDLPGYRRKHRGPQRYRARAENRSRTGL